MIKYQEPHYCAFCDNEAIFKVEWRKAFDNTKLTTYLCGTCAPAYEFGQVTEEAVIPLDSEEEEEEKVEWIGNPVFPTP